MRRLSKKRTSFLTKAPGLPALLRLKNQNSFPTPSEDTKDNEGSDDLGCTLPDEDKTQCCLGL